MTFGRFQRFHPAAGIVAAALIFGLLTGSSVAADDVDPQDRELLEALEGAPADAPQQIVPRLIDNTQAAAGRLEAGQLDEQTRTLQRQILADIDALLEQSSPPGSPPPGQSSAESSPSDQQPQQKDSPSQSRQDPSQPGSDSQSGSLSDPNAAAKESEERSARGEESDGARERRLGLSTAAWGHLPPKVREQMRSAFSEEYLPAYDALVRRYYEALARRRTTDRDRRDGD